MILYILYYVTVVTCNALSIIDIPPFVDTIYVYAIMYSLYVRTYLE